MSGYGYYPPEPPPAEEEPEKPKRRNARARYHPTEAGKAALEAYRATVKDAQASGGGRDALEAAQTTWASSHQIVPRDALLLEELETKPQTILELTRSLDDCGIKRPEVEDGLERMTEQSLVEPNS